MKAIKLPRNVNKCPDCGFYYTAGYPHKCYKKEFNSHFNCEEAKLWEERYNDIFGEKHYEICEGKKCQCHKEVKSFIKNLIQTRENKIKNDLLEIADKGEFEDLRREIFKYFK